MKSWPFKTPEEVFDYGFNWAPRMLVDNPILISTCEVISGSVHKDSHAITSDGLRTVTWLSGGTSGETCALFLTAKTASRTFEQVVYIDIKERR
jgi:hypothetical protein